VENGLGQRRRAYDFANLLAEKNRPRHKAELVVPIENQDSHTRPFHVGLGWIIPFRRHSNTPTSSADTPDILQASF
jgi:hypothetical protein